MHIEMRPLSSITPYENNPRVNAGAVEAVIRSIREFGWRQPIVVDTEGVIVVGHTRYLAAREMGLEEVPVHVATDLTPARIRAYRIADNRTAEIAEWDYHLLPIELAELQGVGFDLDLLGFDADELARLLGGEVREGLTDPDEAPEVPEVPITRPGELILLGDHRLLCADSRAEGNVARVMSGDLADLYWTDPPYNVAYVGKTKDALTFENDAMEDPAFRSFLGEAFGAASPHLKPGACFYVAHADTEGYNFRGAVRDAGWYLAQCLVWVKDQFVLGRQDYHWRHEPVLYGWKPGAAHRALEDRTQDTVWECARPRRSEAHPTMKPVELVARALRNSTAHGAVVLDSFLGSGSTLIACERLGRRCRALELDPAYCDVAVRRWEEFTGSKAERHPAEAAA